MANGADERIPTIRFYRTRRGDERQGGLCDDHHEPQRKLTLLARHTQIGNPQVCIYRVFRMFRVWKRLLSLLPICVPTCLIGIITNIIYIL